ncbi:MAG: hypothetical protein PVJ21_16755 [Anaerolineales bacterium]|jgi:hypothetical protein
MDNIFSNDDIIHTYSRKEALEDGFQVDANIGEFAEVTKQHHKFPVYMTRGVYELIERAVKNERWANDWKGVWHDILWMNRVMKRYIDESTVEFQVIIRGAGRKQKYTMIAQVGPMDIDDPSPAVTISLPGED